MGTSRAALSSIEADDSNVRTRRPSERPVDRTSDTAIEFVQELATETRLLVLVPRSCLVQLGERFCDLGSLSVTTPALHLATWFLVALAVLAAASLTACAQEMQLELDVVLRPTGVAVFSREPPCECNLYVWPRPNGCVQASDQVQCTCEPRPGTCLDALWLEGLAQGPGSPDGSGLPWHRAIAVDLEPGDRFQLVLEGCGHDKTAIPVSYDPPPAIAVGPTRRMDGGLEVSVTLPPGLDALTVANGGQTCAVAATSVVRMVPAPNPDGELHVDGWRLNEATSPFDALRIWTAAAEGPP